MHRLQGQPWHPSCRGSLRCSIVACTRTGSWQQQLLLGLPEQRLLDAPQQHIQGAGTAMPDRHDRRTLGLCWRLAAEL